MPRVKSEDVNICIGFGGAPFNTIGFAFSNKQLYGFVVAAEWNVKIPKDCKEVTYTEYRNHFPYKKKNS